MPKGKFEVQDELDNDCFSGKDPGKWLAIEAKTQKKNNCSEMHVSKVFEIPELKHTSVVVVCDPDNAFDEEAE